MLPGFIPYGAAAGLLPFSFEFLQRATGTNAAVQTFSAQNLGAAPALGHKRYIIVAISAVTNGRDLNSVTVNGVTASLVVRATFADEIDAMIYIAEVPSGTSGDVVLTYSGSTEDESSIALYRMMNPFSATAHDTEANNNSVSAGNIAANLNVPQRGCAVAVLTTRNASTTIWTGLTENYDSDLGAGEFSSGAADSFVSAQTPLAISAQNADTSPTYLVLAAASWG